VMEPARLDQSRKTSAGAVAARLFCSAALGAVIGVGPAQAADISYTVDQSIGGGSVTGDITTDGKLGVLSTPDILGWDLTLNGLGASATLTSGGGSTFVLVGGDLTATPTQLLFDFSGSDGGYLLFQENPGLFSGNKYYCINTTNPTCAPGASVVPGAFSDASAQYQAMSGLQIIGTAGQLVPVSGVAASVIALAQARTDQMLVNDLESELLLGLNEQISCGSCGGVGLGVGSYALSGHGRYALTPDWTLLGGANVGQYEQRGVNVSLDAGFAAALQFDPSELGPSRPYAEVGVSGALQNVQYKRRYPTAQTMAVGVGSTRDYELGVQVSAGWVDRVTPRDEAAVYASYSRTWQMVGAYSEQVGGGNPVSAAVPSGTDVMNVASLNAQYTHLFGLRVEAGVNGGADWAFSPTSGLRPTIGGFAIATTQPNFVYYDVGGRIGYRINSRATVDVFVNGIIAPRSLESSVHGGIDARWAF
jgi:hypothetical protein